jgi:GWxTD domain-containing protein
MKTMRSFVLLLAVAIAVQIFAANPPAKDWDHSPQSYFMTKAEQLEWTALKGQEESAQHFIDQFLAKRGPNFAAEVAARAEQADKHLTIGKLAGSKTLRGKLVILLGPPSGLEVYPVRETSSVHRSSPAVANAYGGGNGNGEDDSTESGRTMGAEGVSNNYHFTYASTVAGPLDVTINAEQSTGRDRARGRDDAKKLDAAFEAAAQASIKTK